MAVPTIAAAAGDLAIPDSSSMVFQWRHRHDSDNAPDFSTEARQRLPWFVSLGAFFPDFSGDNTSNSVGTEVAVGYRFAVDNADFRVSARGMEYDITDAFLNQSTIDVSEISFEVFYRLDAFYIGPGISFGSVTGTTDGFTFSGQNQTIWSLAAGYDITPRIFVEARWQTADVDAYKGYSINFGYRF